MKTPATPEDFKNWETRADAMSEYELWCGILDSVQARDAAEEIGDAIGAGRYADEAGTYRRELNKRRADLF